MRRVRSVLLLLGLLALVSPGGAIGAPPFDPAAAVAALPSRFSGWDVQLTAASHNPQQLTLSFQSALLRQRVGNVIWLPDSYDDKGGRLPGVMYYLHGTSFIHTDPATPATQALADTQKQLLPSEDFLYETYPYGGYFAGAHRFHTLLDRQNFLTVVLDTQQPTHWCGYCWWIDGRDGQGVLAESHLYEELIPLVQALFDVRSDRGGRALVGHSMGGTGALVQAFRHPDRWAYVGETGGTVPNEAHWLQWHSRVLWPMYYRGQGYGPHSPTEEIHYRNVDALTLASNMLGQGVEIFMALGDGCRYDDASPLCESTPRAGGGPHFGDDLEADYRKWTEGASVELSQMGVPHFFLKRRGLHVPIIYDTYTNYMLDRINAVFASDVPTPSVFSHKTVDTKFDVWGYDVLVERPNSEFLSLIGARTDGTSFVVAGSGTATITTPPAFLPHHKFDVRVVPSQRGAEEVTPFTLEVRSDGQGRITLTDLDLGPVRTHNEQLALVRAGEFSMYQTQVQIVDAARTD